VHSPGLLIFAVALALVGLIRGCMGWRFERVVASEHDIASFDYWNREKFRLEYTAIKAYRSSGKLAVLSDGNDTFKLPEIDVECFHQVMACKAPKALNAKRLRTLNVPPKEDFTSLWLFDYADFFTAMAKIGLLAVPFVLIGLALLGVVRSILVPSTHETPLGFMVLFMILQVFVQTGLPHFYDLKDVCGYLSVETTGISASWPGRHQRLDWLQVEAVFCHYRDKRRYFILVGQDTSIIVPPPIARELEVMRKIVYSLPDRVLCVNFDQDTFKKGYRRRRKKRRLGIYTGAPTEVQIDLV